MRIISGKYKGKRLRAPKNLPVRPTTDMAKEALFNILQNHFDFEAISVLDLFSGTGNISFEFASRGTAQIVSVDKDYRCVKFIASVSKELGLNIRTFKDDAFKFLERTDLKFDLIFADPPYNMDLTEFNKIVTRVFRHDLLKEHGMLIIEHSKHTDLSELPYFIEQRKYGGSVFSFFRIPESQET
ncbi:MAG: 16S rRNA (guanine(966)-N(2))-methyltransferase RsmD [Eudoraea sp.]|nr:16S rRNA (guanine(966)-N(2))-methyltransferase RsmD [Eudoraea sp.]MBT8322648.1 16S rRNA (guanine(966)-N(2))-methyltransferase RsmD [Eudoraea sp.]NNJ38760.1 16S rRNA (guanine(966)-N(2))-methyltransferase RsmD [Flavobacteriaceae bacterium]